MPKNGQPSWSGIDSLTRVANRASGLDDLENRLGLSTGKVAAVLFVDLDNFKHVNDDYGHDTGDQILVTVAKRLTEAVRRSDCVVRFGGDEFLVITTVDEGSNEPVALAHRLIELAKEPIRIGGIDFHQAFSIGVAVQQTDGVNVDELVREADLAMYEAKSNPNPNQPKVFLATAASSQRLRRQQIIASDFGMALVRGELHVEYQAVRRLSDLEILGADGFVRWGHSKLGTIQPDEFLNVARSPTHIKAFTTYVLETITAAWARLRETNPKFSDKAIAISVDPLQLLLENYVSDHKRILANSGLRLDDVMLVVQDLGTLAGKGIRDALEALAHAGIPVVLEFFGVSYNAFEYIDSVPIVGIKLGEALSRSLVIEAGLDRRPAEAVVLGTQLTADKMGIMTLAVGLETVEQVKLCAALGISCGQGLALGEPMPIEKFRDSESAGEQAKIDKAFQNSVA